MNDRPTACTMIQKTQAQTNAMLTMACGTFTHLIGFCLYEVIVKQGYSFVVHNTQASWMWPLSLGFRIVQYTVGLHTPPKSHRYGRYGYDLYKVSISDALNKFSSKSSPSNFLMGLHVSEACCFRLVLYLRF